MQRFLSMMLAVELEVMVSTIAPSNPPVAVPYKGCPFPNGQSRIREVFCEVVPCKIAMTRCVNEIKWDETNKLYNKDWSGDGMKTLMEWLKEERMFLECDQLGMVLDSCELRFLSIMSYGFGLL